MSKGEQISSKLVDAEPVAQHPDDVAVDAFAAAMKAKLAEARAKGRGGWQGNEPGMQQRLSDMLRTHVEKGDPRDVANFCMFLHRRGETILPAVPEAQGEAVDAISEALRQAVCSLRTIERGAMREEYLDNAEDVRAYARSRADVAENALHRQINATQPRAVPDVRFTYKDQPNNIEAWRLGEACCKASKDPAGDYIDSGLGLLRRLQEKGYGVFRLAAPQPGEPA